SNLFLDEGVIVSTKGRANPTRYHRATKANTFEFFNLVVLVNDWSARASEIVAGAIQDHDRGLLIGTTSFGKGSVQIPTALENNQGAVRITIARWLTPKARTIHQVGLPPDIEVEFTEDDFSAGVDPQLEKAIEILLSQ
ncbi:MAG: hypothetical protein KAS36_15580, partial [Anaerolineales bacterium]|nr:hypothetical protein [Anaerolineales bacterium]